MLNVNIWVKHPYPFRWEEQQAIQEALRTTYGVQAVYFKEWPVDYVTIENITMTTAKQIASTLKFVHRQAAIRDRRVNSRVYAEDADVEIRGRLDGRPEWAKEVRT